MRMFMKTVLVLSGLLLVGCGGGGGAASTTGTLVYEGKKGPADLDLNGVKALVEDADIPYGDLISLADNTNNKIEMKTIATMQHIKKVEGSISGTVDTEEEYVDELTTKTTMIFTDFNDGDGIINGKIIFVKSYNRSLYDDANMTEGGVYLGDIRDFYVKKLDIRFENLNIKDSESDITIQGSFVKESEGEGKSLLTQNLIVKNNTDNQMIKLENFIIALDQYERALSYNGRIYDSGKGYIDISTLSEFEYNTQGRPTAGGIIRYEGKETVAFEKIAYENSIRVEIDNGKDGVIDTVEVYNAETLEVIPNREPVIAIIFPQSIYTDTDMSGVQVNVYDPDLDGFTTSYEWAVNGEVKSNSFDLGSELFAKHNMLKLTLIATDERTGDKKSGTLSKEQVVLNSRPVIKESFNDLEITIGDTTTLEYTVSDADNDELNITWKHYLQFEHEIQEDDYWCQSAIQDYDMLHPDQPFDSLNEQEQEDYIDEVCATNVYRNEVELNFVVDNTFEAIAPGEFTHELIVSDGDYNKTKLFDSNIFKMDLVSTTEYNHEQYSYASGAVVHMEDFDNDGNKDLIYIGSVTKHSEGDTFEEPTGEVFKTDPYEYESPVLVIEYRNGKTVLNKETYDVSGVGYNDFYVKDMNGDGKLDILFSTTDGYRPPTNKTFKVMYQNTEGTLQDIESFDLENYDSFSVNDMDGDGTQDIITLILSQEWDETKQIWDEFGMVNIYLKDKNLTASTTIPHHSSHYSVGKKVFSYDLNHDGKQDIVIVNKSRWLGDNSLSFECRILMQNENEEFVEKEYSKILDTNVKEFEAVTDTVIADIAGMQDVFIVSTTNNIYLLNLDENSTTIVNKLPYSASKNKSSTSLISPIDINHDGKKDIVVFDTSTYATQLLSIFIQKENNEFFVEQNYSFGDGYSEFMNPGYAFGDIDGDGQYEVFFNSGDDELSSIYFK